MAKLLHSLLFVCLVVLSSAANATREAYAWPYDTEADYISNDETTNTNTENSTSILAAVNNDQISSSNEIASEPVPIQESQATTSSVAQLGLRPVEAESVSNESNNEDFVVVQMQGSPSLTGEALSINPEIAIDTITPIIKAVRIPYLPPDLSTDDQIL